MFECFLFKVLIAHAGTVQNKKPVQFCTCFIFCASKEHSSSIGYGRVLDWGQRVASLSLTAGGVSVLCPHCSILVQPRKTYPYMTVKLLTGT